MLDSKDVIIDMFKEEIQRKNQLISELLEKQEQLESRLVKMEAVLMFDDKDFEDQTGIEAEEEEEEEKELFNNETNANTLSEDPHSS